MIQPHDSIVVQRIARILIPLIQIFSLYVFFHGHHSPGGGFQGGVLMGASLILGILVGTPEETQKFSLNWELRIGALGLFVYGSAGLLAVLAHAPFLDYSALAFLGDHIATRRFMGILWVETGIFIVVAVTLVIIFHALTNFGALKRK